MKIVRLLAMLVALVAVQVSSAAPEPVSVEDRHATDLSQGQRLLIVHYHRQDDDYDGWNLWSWTEGAEGESYAFEHKSPYGRYALVRTAQRGPDRQGLIVRRNDWEARDIGHDRFVDLGGDPVTEVWLVAGNPAVFTDPEDVDLSVAVTSAFLDSSDAVTFTASGPLDKETLAGVRITSSTGSAYAVGEVRRSARSAPGGVVYDASFSPRVRTEDVAKLRLDVPGMGGATVYARDVLDEDRFTSPLMPLGALYTPERTVFRVWSPVSDEARVEFYRSHRSRHPVESVEMSPVGNGVWEAAVDGDQNGRVYEYRFRSYGKVRHAADINARAATMDSSRSVVVDLDALSPEGWGDREPPAIASPLDEVIYEIHVRDFSIRTPGLDPLKRGTYLGLIEPGGTPRGTKTGLSHLQELGVTAVHLLPVHDYPGSKDEYNWGYWTSLFNVPEGNYATNPADPTSAIRELKTAIQGLHEADIRVILDVVYNHTSSSFEYSHFDNTVPWYYFRTTVDGRLRNDAGVGNSIADERVMARDYIGDSLEFWARAYRVDGFRFDLLGTHHPASVREWLDRLADVRDDLTIYGEPWTGGGPTYFPKGAQRGMGIAVFNDHLRNAIRGDLDGDAKGYATGPWGDVDSIKRGVMGAIDDFTDQPTETVNYASAHDNLTLWDKITRVTPGATDETRRAMQNLAHAIVLTSQGTAFIHGGADYCRTKGGNHNSYNAGDDVNAFDWARKHEYQDVVDYTAGLIELRNSHPAFRMRTTRDIRRNLSWLDTSDERLIAYRLDGEAVGDEWGEIIVVYNGADVGQTMRLPGGAWNRVVDAERAGTRTLDRVTGAVDLPAYSAAVLWK